MDKKIWTIKKIKNGFEEFYRKYKKYPTANEIDDFKLLPSSRQIQRRYGGLIKLRKKLGLKISNYSTGAERSMIASIGNRKRYIYENKVRKILQNKFGNEFVHIERPASNGYKIRLDFYVFAKPSNFAVDVFTTYDIRTLIRNMNIKTRKYNKAIKGSKEKIFFVYSTDTNIRDRVKLWQKNSKENLPSNWEVIDINEFNEKMKAYSNYQVY